MFEGLAIWNEEKYRQIQGTYPVTFFSLAGVKANNIQDMKALVEFVITNLYGMYKEIMKSDKFDESDRESFVAVNEKMEDFKAQTAIHSLCIYLEKYYGKKVIVLLDEYDTPMQEAWLGDYWDEAVAFFRSFFDNTFKTNSHLSTNCLNFLYFQGFAVCPTSKYVSFSLVFALIGKLQGKVFVIQFSLLNSFPQLYPRV